MRLEITRKADLAVRAMALLGGAGGRMKATEVADALDTTRGFVPQVLLPLVKAGWVTSDPGPTGGYRLVHGVDLGRVSVLDVVEAVDGPTEDGRCVVADRPCGSVPLCALHDAWSRARAELTGALRQMPLSEVAAGRTDATPTPTLAAPRRKP